jgi:hypothetical protein
LPTAKEFRDAIESLSPEQQVCFGFCFCFVFFFFVGGVFFIRVIFNKYPIKG